MYSMTENMSSSDLAYGVCIWEVLTANVTFPSPNHGIHEPMLVSDEYISVDNVTATDFVPLRSSLELIKFMVTIAVVLKGT